MASKNDVTRGNTAAEKPGKQDVSTADAATTPQADPEEKPTRKARGNPMLGRGQRIDTDGVLMFGADVKTLVEEIQDRLDAEVVDPLTDMETSVRDPQSAALVESSRQLRGHVDTVAKALRVLASAAGRLGQGPVA